MSGVLFSDTFDLDTVDFDPVDKKIEKKFDKGNVSLCVRYLFCFVVLPVAQAFSGFAEV